MRKDVENYLYGLLPKRDRVIREMEEYAARHRVAIIGPAVARLLALLVHISRAKRIFELGSAIGYSTIWLARAAGAKGEVTYTDGNPENAKLAETYFRQAGLTKRIFVKTGDALTLLRRATGKFDLIFNDIDKHEYPDAARIALPKLRRGGLFITDNTLWGKAARQAPAGDADTRGIQELNRLLHRSKGMFTVLIPLRDGVTVCRKQ